MFPMQHSDQECNSSQEGGKKHLQSIYKMFAKCNLEVGQRDWIKTRDLLLS